MPRDTQCTARPHTHTPCRSLASVQARYPCKLVPVSLQPVQCMDAAHRLRRGAQHRRTCSCPSEFQKYAAGRGRASGASTFSTERERESEKFIGEREFIMRDMPYDGVHASKQGLRYTQERVFITAGRPHLKPSPIIPSHFFDKTTVEIENKRERERKSSLERER